MSGFFNLDNPVWRFIGKLADVFILSVLWTICSLPIFTIGAATTAMYYVTLKLASDDEGYTVRGFFKSFKLNFKQSTIIWLIIVVVGLVLYVDIRFFWSMDSTVGKVFSTIFLAVILMGIFMVSYIFPVTARFYNSTKKMFINALFMSIRHLGWTILNLIIAVAVLIASIFFPPLMIVSVGLTAFLTSYCFNHIFKKYMPETELEHLDEAAEMQRAIDRLTDEIKAKEGEEGENAGEAVDETAEEEPSDTQNFETEEDPANDSEE